MTTETAPGTGGAAPGTRRRTRALAVLGGVVAAFAVWVVAVPVLGVDLDARMGSGSGADPQRVGPGAVLVASLLVGLAGWGLLALLERGAPERARTRWTAVAVVVLVLSLAGPLPGGATTAAKVALTCMHLAAGAVLIPLLSRSATRR
ncbi:DUF6069 family protein [Peterkaempfera bronchialis]|uniref:Uncharacterized protein n=1 Tax=Peterkaempfera bronchialis TaxID=2126346 RepID=A0A345T2U7_9ACTN|nr:DUF6069 family protein [Peterkaempfera bronchialis]AXI80302.1 hypothetical protein C7M71_025790 [Peterkaempfera bronchialis]